MGKETSELDYTLFEENTEAIIYGYHANPIQRMLDFDFICRRKTSSVVAIVNPNREGIHKAFWGSGEILIPMYRSIKNAARKHPNASVLINFASFRSAYPTTMEALREETIRTVVVIAEGVPERQARELIAMAKRNDRVIIGPATVGGIRAGAFRIGNTAGTIENIIASKLYRPGCVGFVSKSGGMANEMFNVIARNTNGLYEGIAIGGDLFPGSTLLDHILRYEANPAIKMMVALGEVGGEDEYKIVEALEQGKITKPLVMWVIGTCAKVFPTEVQFGHASAKARSYLETADAKNEALRKAGAIVPNSFDDFGDRIQEVFEVLREKGEIPEVEEASPPQIPMDFAKAVSAGLVRRPANFICTISDDRGEEPTYVGVPISTIVEENFTLGEIIGLLWFKKRLPAYAAKFLEMVLIITADHGPAVSGAHSGVVAARAGKDLISSLCSGLLTVGPRFGGAINDAARYFKGAYDSKMSPHEFVEDMKAKGIYIPGIGHRIKSVQNPDKRVELLIDYARSHFSHTKYLDYALEVEKITTKKRGNLILNVDGCVGVLFLDLMESCGNFTEEEINHIVEMGCLNGLFVLGRSIGIIGHILDQYRLKSPLYRHPWDDILYATEEEK